MHTSEPQGPESQMEEGGDLEGQMENVCNKEVCRFLVCCQLGTLETDSETSCHVQKIY